MLLNWITTIMLQIENIRGLNIEVSSKCIGFCPFCSRRQKVRPYKDQTITFSEFKLLPESFLKQLQIITFSGNFGDLCSNPEVVDISKHVKNINGTIRLGGDTNGSAQDGAWWKALGELFHDGCMVFSLDGLEKTHSLHRKGTDFKKIVRNIQAFINGGGVAQWKFIVFEHNEHQIKTAEALAKDIGCSRFFVISSRDYNEKLRKPKTFDFQMKRDIFFLYGEKSKKGNISAICKPLNNGSIYIAADGTVHPCCFAHCMYVTEHNPLFQYIVPLIEKYHTEINFKTKPLQDIVEGPYFKEVLSQSKANDYCTIKCNRYKKEVRKKLVLYDTYFIE